MGNACNLANITFPTPVITNNKNPIHNFQFLVVLDSILLTTDALLP